MTEAFPRFPASVMMHHVIDVFSLLRKEELVKVDAQVDRLVRDMNCSIAEANKFIQAMEKDPA
jgi:hypothetical protein